MPPHDEAGRERCLQQAGYNILNLPAHDVPFDFFTDVPHDPYVPAVRAAALSALTDPGAKADVAAGLEALYGPAHYVVVSKGRTAEHLLLEALGARKPVVLTHGLFDTALRALARVEARLEMIPVASGSGSADVDLDWLSSRLARGDVDLVYLEPANNSLGGWPLHTENWHAVKRLCESSRAKLILDGTRLLTNCGLLGRDIRDTARAFIAEADAIILSCAKELLWPCGGAIGVRDFSTYRQAFQAASERGLTLEPELSRAGLAAGIAHVLEHGSIIEERIAQVRRLSEALTRLGVEVLTPCGGHAVYVAIDPTLLGSGTKLEIRALQAHLYRTAGVRAWPSNNPRLGRSLLRLAVPIGGYTDARISDGARAVDTALRAASAGIPSLVEEPGPAVHDFWVRYRPV